MSTPFQGRALRFPVLSAKKRGCSATLPQIPKTLSPSDEELMARLLDGDVSAIDLLYARHARLVMGIGFNILHDCGEAEDVVQDSFFQLFQKARLFNPQKGKVKGWLVHIAIHRSLDRKAYLERRGFYARADGSSLDDTLLGETDLDREIGAKLSCAQLENAFDELPDAQRQTLELFFFEEMGLRDISEKLQLKLGNVRHHFYRGLDHLRKSAFVRQLREK